jgi:signal transduction histidine kinase
VTQQREPAPALRGPALAANLVGLVLLTLGVSGEAHLGASSSGTVAVVLLVAADAAWLTWTWARWRDQPAAVVYGLVSILAVTGGALVGFAPIALTYVAVASYATAMRWDVRRSVPVAVLGPASAVVALAAGGHALDLAVSAVSASLGGAVIGMGRRDAQAAAERAASIEVARARAEVLEARNHLARELHDVLAHTLSALAVQLQALEAEMYRSGRPPDPAVAEQLEQAARLVRSGLDEARGAAQVLREDLPPLEDRLATLVAGRARLCVRGRPRSLAPDAALSLYRAAQEALTNVTKHAPGAEALVELDFDPASVGLRVTNPLGVPSPTGAAASADATALAASGGGYGLQGIRERMRLLGGSVQAGPADGVWVVAVRVPA